MVDLFLYLLVLAPAFLIAYRRNWRGPALALSVLMAVGTIGHSALVLLELDIESRAIPLGIAAGVALIALAAGWRSELVQSLMQTKALALTDELTGMANRRRARDFLATEFAAAERGRSLAVVLFDLDLFKEYNDVHGHQVGDEALKAFAQLLKIETRRMDICARYGGEEFLCVLTESELEGIVLFVERVRARVGQIDRVPAFTVSAGVALYRAGMGSPDELVAAADGALYEAKHQGRDEYRIAGESANAGLHGVGLLHASSEGRTQMMRVQDDSDRGAGQPRKIRMRADFSTALPLHDPVTGLHNRAGFVRRLQRSIDRASRQPTAEFCILLLDLDQFQLVNGSLGREAGDELLHAVARRLEYCVRPEDMVARLTADEFVILLNKAAEAADSARVAERILGAFAKPFHIGGSSVFTSGSIGIVDSGGYSTAEEMLRDVNLAMAGAKQSGRASYRLFDSSLHERAVSRLQLENDIRRGLDAGEFVPHYQPLVSLADGRLLGLEALARWNHPTRGVLLPAEFIQVLEQMGLIVPLGRAILEHALTALAAWTRDFPHRDVYVSVNLTGMEFADPQLEEVVNALLEKTAADPHRLRLELTERVLVSDVASAVERLDRLATIGVLAMVDDFGTGYSSLNYIHRLPVKVIKIDRSFVAELKRGGREETVLRHVVALAHALDLEVLAEGVESQKQRRMLVEIGCDSAQGNYFSPPLAAPALEPLLSGRRSLPGRVSSLLTRHPSEQEGGR